MNIQNLLGQLLSSNNPIQMMMGMLNPQQKQAVNQFQNQSSQEQAQRIAEYCNRNGISKDQLAGIIGMMRK